jgi:hypothetical protein
MSALVLLPKGSHREIAQKNWGLTNEQMKGMHVHHRIPRSKGGTDAPENLYVCSPWFHQEVWHQGRYKQIVGANSAAAAGGLTNKAIHQEAKTGYYSEESHRKSSRTRTENGSLSRAGRAGGKISGSRRSKKQMGEIGVLGGLALASQRWQCTVTGYISTPAGLSNYQKKRGIPSHNRVRIQ